MEERIKQLEDTVSELVTLINSLGNANAVPKQMADAIGARILGVSAKSAATGTQAVNEGGSAQYSVMIAPTGFVKGYIQGKEVDIPYI